MKLELQTHQHSYQKQGHHQPTSYHAAYLWCGLSDLPSHHRAILMVTTRNTTGIWWWLMIMRDMLKGLSWSKKKAVTFPLTRSFLIYMCGVYSFQSKHSGSQKKVDSPDSRVPEKAWKSEYRFNSQSVKLLVGFPWIWDSLTFPSLIFPLCCGPQVPCKCPARAQGREVLNPFPRTNWLINDKNQRPRDDWWTSWQVT